MVTLTLLPSMVGASILPPSAAVVTGIGILHSRLLPSRLKNGCGLMDRNIYRSPGSPPRAPASPSLARRMRVPSSTPAGILTSSDFSLRILPEPAHLRQGFLMILPAPWHDEQVRSIVKKP